MNGGQSEPHVARHGAELNDTNSSPEVEVVLSRPAYRLGGTVVGTIRLVASSNTTSPRSFYKSAQVYVAGRCRVDKRWHDAKRYKELYGSHPLLDSVMDKRVEERVAQTLEESTGRDGSTVCFWATNVVNLLELEERQAGRWEDVKPQPLRTSGSSWEKPSHIGSRASHLAENGSAPHELMSEARTQGSEEKWCANSINDDPLAKRQLAFTFRVDLPLDLAPTTTATSCRYMYSAVVCAKTSEGELFVVQAPYIVMSPLAGGKANTSSPAPTVRLRVGTCIAMAHSMGLPCHVSATELNQPSGQITVNRHVGLLSASRDCQTMRVADGDGTLCCVLTAMGSSVVYPGGRILLQFDFPRHRDDGVKDNSLDSSFLPCAQVSACFEGEEFVVNEDGTRNRARSYFLGGTYEVVESGYTDKATLSLCLPLDCPFTVQTELLKIDVRCKVEITVTLPDTKGYSILRLDLPCQVVPSPTADEMRDDEEDDLSQMTSLEELIRGPSETQSDSRAPHTFRSSDIMSDLKVLSTLMIDDSGL